MDTLETKIFFTRIETFRPHDADPLIENQSFSSWGPAVILLQIVMVSRGTRLQKNHESQSRTNTEPMSPQKSPKLKMLGPLCNQTVNLKTDSKTLYYSVLTETTKAKRIGIVKQQP